MQYGELPYGRRQRASARVGPQKDDAGTHRRLYTLLLEKVKDEDDIFGRNMPNDGSTCGARSSATAAVGATPKTRRTSLPGVTDDVAGVVEDSGRGPPAGLGGGMANDGADSERQTTQGKADLEAMAAMKDLQVEREAFVNSICSETTRIDVQDWVGRIFDKMAKQTAEERAAESKRGRKDRHTRTSRTGSGANSESGVSGTTLTGGGTGSGTVLAAAGASLAGASTNKAPSLISAESLVVHHGQGMELLSVPERLRAYLADEIPELKVHVNACVAAKVEEVRKRIDEDLGMGFLKHTTKRSVFDGRANYLRWQNTRRAAIQRVLDADMPKWIWESVQSWDQLAYVKGREADVSDTDLVFDYLTKRAAHIDQGKLATEIPIFKPLMASYSLPNMWRDKYLA